MMTNYYYSESKKTIVIATNFEYNPIPKGFKKISKAKYEELQEELQQESQNENDEIPKVEYNE